MKLNITREQAGRALISLLLAFFLWIIATANTNPIKTVRYTGIPVEYINVSEDLAIDNPLPTVTIRISGTTAQVAKANRNDIRAVVDMESITKSGEYTVEVTVLGLPDSVTITEISDKYVLVRVGNVISTSSNFELESTNSLAGGYILLHTSYNDTEVSVSGSDNLTEKIACIKGYIDLQGRSQSFDCTAVLNAYDEAGNRIDGVIISPSSIDVHITVGTTKTVPINVVTSGELSEGFSLGGITLSSPGVTIAGEVQTIEGINTVDTAEVDLTGRDQSFDVTLEYVLPSGITLYSTDETVAHFTVNRVSAKTVTYGNIQTRNAGNASVIITEDIDLSVTVKADEYLLDSITEDVMPAYIDLSGLEDGDHEVSIQFDVPEGVTILDTTMKTLKVTIKHE